MLFMWFELLFVIFRKEEFDVALFWCEFTKTNNVGPTATVRKAVLPQNIRCDVIRAVKCTLFGYDNSFCSIK